MLFVVFSPREDTPDELRDVYERIASRYQGLIRYACIEFGRHGTHPHLNIVMEVASRTDSVRRTIIGLLDRDIGYNALNISVVSEYTNLVCGYLRKESEAIVLNDSGWSQEMQAEFDSRPPVDVPPEAFRLITLGERKVIEMAILYFKDEAAPELSSETFRYWQHKFALKFYCSRVKWARVYTYVALHLADEPVDPMDYPNLYDI